MLVDSFVNSYESNRYDTVFYWWDDGKRKTEYKKQMVSENKATFLKQSKGMVQFVLLQIGIRE